MGVREYMRTSYTDKEGKKHYKTFSVAKYGEELCEKLIKDWKRSIRDGTEFKMPEYDRIERAVKDVAPESHFSPDIKAELKAKEDKVDKIERKPFELKIPDRKYGCSIMLLGMTRSGKSYALNHIYDTYFKDHIGVLHTNSLQSDIYTPLKKLIRCPTYLPDMLDETHKINKATDNKYEFLHIVDDVVNKKNDKDLISLLTIGRNSRNSIIITAQELSIMNAIGRSNINFICLLKLGSDMAIEKVVKSYLRSYFPAYMSLNEQIKMYKKLTEDHNMFVIDNLNSEIFLTKIEARP
jgi:hypothetical protein